jgi:hypothetical protein
MADAAKVTDVGMGITTNRIKGAGTEPKHIGWGIGTTGAANGDTGLESASAEARTDGTSTREQTNVANDTYQVVGTVTCAGAGKAITEVVLMDAATDGNCYLRGTFSAINVSVGDSVAFTIKSVHDQAA